MFAPTVNCKWCGTMAQHAESCPVHLLWKLEQKVSALEKDVEHYKNAYIQTEAKHCQCDERIEALEKEKAELVEVLTWYADDDNFSISEPMGDKAEEALSKSMEVKDNMGRTKKWRDGKMKRVKELEKMLEVSTASENKLRSIINDTSKLDKMEMAIAIQGQVIKSLKNEIGNLKEQKEALAKLGGEKL